MNPKLKALQDELQKNLGQIDTLLAKGNDMTDADMGTAQELHVKNEGISTQIRTLQSVQSGRDATNTFLNGMPAPQGNGGAPDPGTLLGFQPAGKSFWDGKEQVEEGGHGLLSEKQMQAISTKEYKYAFLRMIKAGGHQMLGYTDLKTLQEGIDDQGGFLVPADIMMSLISKKPVPTSTLARVRQLETSKDRIQRPKTVYTADNKYTTPVRLSWVGEVPASPTASRATAPTFGMFECDVHTALMSLPITNDMIEDSGVAITEYIQEAFGQTVDLMGEDLILNGTGVKQPHGILENPGGLNEPQIVYSGSAASLLPDGLKNLQYAVPPQYQANAAWVMSWMNTAKVIEQMKDANNRYLWGEGVQESGLSKSSYDRPLLSRPIAYNEFSQVPGAGTFPIVYGDLAAYYWVKRIGFSIQVLNEMYAEVNQKLLLGRIRVGGDVAEDWALAVQQCHV